MDNKQFKGRKGQKRLKELNERIEQTLSMIDEYAATSSEMGLLLRSIPDPVTRLGFVEACRVLDDFWSGIRTCGFLRLCAEWVRRKKLTELDGRKIDEMFAEFLPALEMQKVRAIKTQSLEA